MKSACFNTNGDYAYEKRIAEEYLAMNNQNKEYVVMLEEPCPNLTCEVIREIVPALLSDKELATLFAIISNYVCKNSDLNCTVIVV